MSELLLSSSEETQVWLTTVGNDDGSVRAIEGWRLITVVELKFGWEGFGKRFLNVGTDGDVQLWARG